MLRTATTTILLATAVDAHVDTGVVDAVLQRLGHLETIVEQQQTLISAQQKQLASMHQRTASSSVQRANRRLAIDADSTPGISITKDDAGLFMGEGSDVGLVRTGDAELTLVADVVVDGSLFVSSLEESIQDMFAEATSRLDALEKEQLPLAAIQFPLAGGHTYATYTAKTPFGSGDDGLTYVYDYPVTAALGYGRMVAGTYTAPSDGAYFMTTELRIADGESDSVEIEFQVNGKDTNSFEMWLPTTVLRRTGISAGLFYLERGDEITAISDLVPGDGLKGVTTIFKIADDRVAVAASTSGTAYTTGSSLMTAGSSDVIEIMRPSDGDFYDDGVFTAPHAGIYYFTCKVRISDSTSGDMEIEWLKNDAETEGGFEMWLHEGDNSNRRAHMSMALIELDAGDTVMAMSDLDVSNTAKVVFSAFEIADDAPAFKVYNSAAFTYLEKTTPIGDAVEVVTEFERGTDGNYADGIYTIPEHGFYYLTMKMRIEDGNGDDMGIEWKINGADAAHNMVMWMHNGDASGRYSGCSTLLVEVWAGDEVTAVSNLDLDAGEYITQWTFSAFKVQ